ncbi:MAG: hypothetical protein QM520_03645 [Gammaproteobacteria bacterium]|nr:hypothetical protein [Gammaproteobacteria bacterium]
MNLLVELILAITISGILAINTIAKTGRDLDELITNNTATYLRGIASTGLANYIATHRRTLAGLTGMRVGLNAENAGITDVSGTIKANPSIADLINGNFLPFAFPNIAPNGQPVFLLIGHDGGPLGTNCGASATDNCIVYGAVCTGDAASTPTRWGAFNLRGVQDELRAGWLASRVGGQGVVSTSQAISGIRLAGATFVQTAFTVGGAPPIGTVCALTIDGNARYIQRGDTRDPSLQGSLSVLGSLRLSNLQSLVITDDVKDDSGVSICTSSQRAVLGVDATSRSIVVKCTSSP